MPSQYNLLPALQLESRVLGGGGGGGDRLLQPRPGAPLAVPEGGPGVSLIAEGAYSIDRKFFMGACTVLG